MKVVGLVLAVVVAGLASIFGLNYFGYLNVAFFAPRYEEVRRTTFEESRAFNEGMVRDLQNLRLQYIAASPDQRVGLRATILHRFSVYDKSKLPAELRTFYAQLEKGN